MNTVEIHRGTSPIVLGFAHTGAFVPPDVKTELNDRGQQLSDTDWHIEKLYANILLDCTTVRTTVHRYVIDVNRDPEGNSLYPGQNTTGLVPLTDFEGQPIWNNPPSKSEVERRCKTFHKPYHDALEAELERVEKLHGTAILFDCHSIRSKISYLFEGTLPHFNIGTNNGTTCAPLIEASVADNCARAKGYSSIVNGRFKGGWTTRHYGRPTKNWHAIQMEIAQSAYLESESPPWVYDIEKANTLRVHLQRILKALSELANQLGH